MGKSGRGRCVCVGGGVCEKEKRLFVWKEEGVTLVGRVGGEVWE